MVLTTEPERLEQDARLSDTIRRERDRLFRFIRRFVRDTGDAEDILQEVFAELVEAERLLRPIEQVGGWLFRVARNRITDRFRKRRSEAPKPSPRPDDGAGESPQLEDLLPSPEAGPDAALARSLLLEELEAAIDELPPAQRAVFVAHQVMGRSFKELAEETGTNVNTLLARKHKAVLRLRRRLHAIHEEFAGGSIRRNT